MKITSFQNPKIKHLVKLQQKSRERKKENLFVVEGVQENTLAIENNFEPVHWYICEEIFDQSLKLRDSEIIYVSLEIFQKIAYRQTTGGIVGVYKTKHFDLAEITKSNPLIVVLEAVEKPGNLGAILRSCDAANVDAVVICDKKVDFFNPNVIRSSVGTVFTETIIATDKETFIAFANKNKIQILSTYLRDDTLNLYDTALKQSTALVFGTESTGLSDFWLNHSAHTIQIPMLGQVDSLNVSNAVAICVFEAVRQRRSQL
ncbi:RNA methyltransferase [Flavobacteriaceae bacterium Ap0902]|nr:RNA methyltransferase [Flavobacteriaceae bacterium Ap0902]